MKENNPTILLSFDVEEFDLPLEYKQSIEIHEQLNIGKEGLDKVADLLKEQEVAATFFVTGRFAYEFTDTIRDLAQRHEISSHAFFHSTFKREDLLHSRLLLENISGKPVKGFRMPRMKKVNMRCLKEAGYQYDASINPAYLPGRYNNLHLPRLAFQSNDLWRIPCSVTPNLRIPLFWLSFKNFPYALFKQLALQTLKNDGYLSLYFHPWEFIDIRKYQLPCYIARHSNGYLLQRLHQLIDDLRKEAAFSTIDSFLKTGPFGTPQLRDNSSI
jgi:peptidoglycan/xylan/chitin deacetylase (PgdA/CDA1 family)